MREKIAMKRISAVAGFLIGLPLMCFAAAVPSPDKLLPADTLAVFTIPDYAKASKTWSQWPGTLLWKDASMKGFTEKFVAKFTTDIVTPLEREFGMKFSDYAGLAQGQITFAVTQNGWGTQAKSAPGFLLVIDTGDKSSVLKTNLASL